MVLREVLARFGIDFDQAKVQRADFSVRRMVDGLRQFGWAITGSAFVWGVRNFINDMTALGDDLDKASQQIGLSATELTAWQHAAGMSGASAESLSAGMGALARNALAASKGSRAMNQIFRQLGVEVRGADGELRPLADLFAEAGGAIGEIESDTEKAAVAMRLFGRGGRELIPLFNEGTEGMNALRNEVRSLFGTDLEQLAEMGAEVDDAMARWDLGMMAVKTTIALEVLPVVLEFINTAMGVVREFKTISDSSELVKTGLMVVAAAAAAAGIALFIAFAEVLIPAALIGALLFALFLIVEDLYQLFTGGESAIGAWIDQLFGVGSAARFVEAVKKAFNDTVDAVVNGIATLRRWYRTAVITFTVIKAFLTGLFDGPMAAAGGFFNALYGWFSTLQEVQRNVFRAIFDSVKNLASGALDVLQASIGRVAARFGIDLDFDNARQAIAGMGLSAAQWGADRAEGALRAGTRVVQSSTRVGQGAAAVTNHVGQIVVQGTANAEETAHLVATRLREQQAADLSAAQAALVPEPG